MCESPRVTKIVKEIKFEGVWAKLKAKKMLLYKIIHIIFGTNLVSCGIAHYGKNLINILFFTSFFLLLTKFSFLQEAGYSAIILWSLEPSLIFAKFLTS